MANEVVGGEDRLDPAPGLQQPQPQAQPGLAVGLGVHTSPPDSASAWPLTIAAAGEARGPWDELRGEIGEHELITLELDDPAPRLHALVHVGDHVREGRSGDAESVAPVEQGEWIADDVLMLRGSMFLEKYAEQDAAEDHLLTDGRGDRQQKEQPREARGALQLPGLRRRT